MAPRAWLVEIKIPAFTEPHKVSKRKYFYTKFRFDYLKGEMMIQYSESMYVYPVTDYPSR